MTNSAIGTFNYAHSFWGAARALYEKEWETSETHPSSPMEFLYWHAIELFLKAFLQADGVNEDDLRLRYGHKVFVLANECVRRGLPLSKHAMEVISFMREQGDMIDLRYLRIGAKSVPDHDEVDTACCTVYCLVADELVKRGINIGFHTAESRGKHHLCR